VLDAFLYQTVYEVTGLLPDSGVIHSNETESLDYDNKVGVSGYYG